MARIKEAIRHLLPSAVRPRRILAGPLRGQTLVTSWHDYPGALTGRTEHDLLAWFERNVSDGSTWLDVGAHYGYTALALSRLVGRGGRVFAFEPTAQTAGYLAQTVLHNSLTNVTVVPLALGDANDIGLLEAFVDRGMADVRIQESNAVHASATRFLAASLDWLWPRLGASDLRIDGIKIDVQGMELHVLRGMRVLLLEQRPRLVIEFHAGVDRGEALALLLGCGYAPNGKAIGPASGSGDGYLDDVSYVFEAGASVRADATLLNRA